MMNTREWFEEITLKTQTEILKKIEKTLPKKTLGLIEEEINKIRNGAMVSPVNFVDENLHLFPDNTCFGVVSILYHVIGDEAIENGDLHSLMLALDASSHNAAIFNQDGHVKEVISKQFKLASKFISHLEERKRGGLNSHGLEANEREIRNKKIREHYLKLKKKGNLSSNRIYEIIAKECGLHLRTIARIIQSK